ncbi:hypothetical protein ACFL4Z_01770 [candidate division KSB1 bacterium]
MNLEIFESGITFFIFGILLGSTSSIFIVRRIIHKRLKNFYEVFNKLSLQNLQAKKEQEKKIKELKKFVEILDIAQKESEVANNNTFTSYLNELNTILCDRGIAKIEDTVPPS